MTYKSDYVRLLEAHKLALWQGDQKTANECLSKAQKLSKEGKISTDPEYVLQLTEAVLGEPTIEVNGKKVSFIDDSSYFNDPNRAKGVFEVGMDSSGRNLHY